MRPRISICEYVCPLVCLLVGTSVCPSVVRFFFQIADFEWKGHKIDRITIAVKIWNAHLSMQEKFPLIRSITPRALQQALWTWVAVDRSSETQNPMSFSVVTVWMFVPSIWYERLGLFFPRCITFILLALISILYKFIRITFLPNNILL